MFIYSSQTQVTQMTEKHVFQPQTVLKKMEGGHHDVTHWLEKFY